MSRRNLDRHAGCYLVRLHSAYYSDRHKVGEVELTPYDLWLEVEQYEGNHGPAGRTPRTTKGFIDWWNGRICRTTACCCGIVPVIELLRKL